MGRWLWLFVLAGCLEPTLSPCGELVCPAERICVSTSAGPLCATSEQIRACATLADETPCTTSQGTGVCIEQVCAAPVCGNGRRELGEDCDDGNLDAGDGCSLGCRLEACGNGITDQAAGEACDCGDAGIAPRPECRGHNNSDTDPAAPCRTDCTLRTCGDGVVEAPEQCEDTNLGALGCADFGFYTGTLACTQLCTVDISGCAEKCGDGVRQSSHEQCDSGDLDGAGCRDLGFYAGALACNAFCSFDVTGCTGRCGDGIVSPAEGEECDNNAYADNADCTTFGYYGGTRGCSSFCRFDDSQCIGQCGDGMVSNGEACDGTNFGAQSCPSFGFYSGVLSCTSGCTIFAGGCSGYCGDGIRNGGEKCENNDVGTLSCTEAGLVGTVACNDRCQPSFAHCDCGDGKCAVYETCNSCSNDCGPCSCGDGVCTAGETCTTCPDDCGPCGSCGNGTCGKYENCLTCPTDCGVCSCTDGKCVAGENCAPCREECGKCECGDKICGETESCATCPGDCCSPVP